MGWIYPRLVIAAMRGGAGKTTLSLGMTAAWRRRGRKVIPFKKGPDYIDSAWLSLAAQQPCHNLDTFLMGKEAVRSSFRRSATRQGISLIEGNRGLYDGVDVVGSQSTAELSKLLRSPVILIVDCGKVTRTAAAMVLGCQKMDPEVDIRGVILNQIARSRQEEILRKAIGQICGLEVVGAVPRLEKFSFPERHLGLLPPQEHQWIQKALDQAAEVSEQYLDLNRLAAIAHEAGPFVGGEMGGERAARTVLKNDAPLIGVVRDSAFQFYYPENLEALSNRGARVMEVSAIGEETLPPVDALYIGGGFPETHGRRLAENVAFRNSLRAAAEGGLPIYAECGGFMYLGEKLILRDQEFPMAGVLPVSFVMEKRPQGHGYTMVEVVRENPFFPVGRRMRGHEFHYSRPVEIRDEEAYFCFQMNRGTGVDGQRDGFCRKNILATYSHFHALGSEEWAEALIQSARWYHQNHGTILGMQ
jgi:cobyrinic acid a,c-diamide synthase